MESEDHMARMPKIQDLVGGDPLHCDGVVNPSSHLGKLKAGKAVDRLEQIQKSMACAIEEGLSGGTTFGSYDTNSAD
jgi:hypothetical protein